MVQTWIFSWRPKADFSIVSPMKSLIFNFWDDKKVRGCSPGSFFFGSHFLRVYRGWGGSSRDGLRSFVGVWAQVTFGVWAQAFREGMGPGHLWGMGSGLS